MRQLISRYVFYGFHQAKRLAKAHGLDVRVFFTLSAIGMVIQLLYYLPWFKGTSADLGFLVTLRLLGLAAPTYILLKGKRVAPVINASLIIGYTLTTTWHAVSYTHLTLPTN